jgi:hypothetical protein
VADNSPNCNTSKILQQRAVFMLNFVYIWIYCCLSQFQLEVKLNLTLIPHLGKWLQGYRSAHGSAGVGGSIPGESGLLIVRGLFSPLRLGRWKRIVQERLCALSAGGRISA